MRAPLLILSFVLVGCRSAAKSAAPPGPNVITITATDYAFSAPDTIPAGLTTFRMPNHGREPHQAVIAGANGRSFEEIQAAMLKEGPVPKWLTFPAGPGVVIGGDSSNATATIAPGNYLIMCFIPSPDGKLHVQKGMVRRLVVIPALPGRAAAAEPKADLTVTLSDYGFALSAPLTAGTHTLRVENAGPQLHELTFERLAPGRALSDWRRWLAAGMRGEPVTTPAGGFMGPDRGKVGWVTVTLAPGNYLLNCYVPDRKDGKPHFMYGMVQEIAVN
jgi:hypothetical protein